MDHANSLDGWILLILKSRLEPAVVNPGFPHRQKRVAVVALLLAVVFLAASCTKPALDPAESGYSAIPAAVEAEIGSGSAGLSTVEAVLVSAQGQTVVAHYRNGRSAEDSLHVWSVSKSVVSALVGIAINDGLIGSLDDNLATLMPRYRAQMSPDVAKVTLRQLMDMTAGFPGDDPASEVESVFKNPTDPVPMILKKGLDRPAGKTWVYSSISAHLVSAVLREALIRANPADPETVLAYAQQKLFDPLEINSSSAWSQPLPLPPGYGYPNSRLFGWGTDGGGLQSGCCLLHMRPEDMVKLGELYLGDGVWHGKRILPEGWVQQSTTPGKRSPEYGLMWYQLTIQGQRVVAAQGRAGQLVAIFPDRQLVVVIASVEKPNAVMSYTDPWTIIENSILPELG